MRRILCAPTSASVMHRSVLPSDRFQLRDPKLSLEREYRTMLQEMLDTPPHNGFWVPPQPDDFAELVEALRTESRGEGLAPGRVPQTTWWCEEEGGRLVGILRLRHRLNDSLMLRGGHLGFIVRPSDRGRGVATVMLRLGLKKATEIGLRRVLLTCDTRNEPSRRTIERNGGVLDGEPIAEEQAWLRYWINIEHFFDRYGQSPLVQ